MNMINESLQQQNNKQAEDVLGKVKYVQGAYAVHFSHTIKKLKKIVQNSQQGNLDKLKKIETNLYVTLVREVLQEAIEQ